MAFFFKVHGVIYNSSNLNVHSIRLYDNVPATRVGRAVKYISVAVIMIRFINPADNTSFIGFAILNNIIINII